jgi:hypothetical protein
MCATTAAAAAARPSDGCSCLAACTQAHTRMACVHPSGWQPTAPHHTTHQHPLTARHPLSQSSGPRTQSTCCFQRPRHRPHQHMPCLPAAIATLSCTVVHAALAALPLHSQQFHQFHRVCCRWLAWAVNRSVANRQSYDLQEAWRRVTRPMLCCAIRPDLFTSSSSSASWQLQVALALQLAGAAGGEPAAQGPLALPAQCWAPWPGVSCCCCCCDVGVLWWGWS